MSLDLSLKQLHVVHIKVILRMQYIRLLLFCSVILPSVIFHSFSSPANSSPANSAIPLTNREIFRSSSENAPKVGFKRLLIGEFAITMMFVSSSGLGLSVVVRECCPVFDSISVSKRYDVITYCCGVSGSNSAIKRCSAVASIAPV